MIAWVLRCHVEAFDVAEQVQLVNSPEQALSDDPLGEFELHGELRWLVRWN
jgi:hypothetical protein